LWTTAKHFFNSLHEAALWSVKSIKQDVFQTTDICLSVKGTDCIKACFVPRPTETKSKSEQ